MRYMFLVYKQESAEPLAPEDRRRHIDAVWSVIEDAREKGILIAVDGLQPTPHAVIVRRKNGKPMTIDGPFAETKEQFAGYYIFECRDMDEAIAWASRIPPGCNGKDGCIEIRPVTELPRRS